MHFDPEALSTMRSILSDVCRDVPASENHVRTYVATRLIECAGGGEDSVDALKQAANIALLETYTGVDFVRALPAEINWLR
jgi:hypothetical protein